MVWGGGEKKKRKKNANYPDRTGDLQMDREVFSLALSRSGQVQIEPMTSTELNPPQHATCCTLVPKAQFGGS